MLYSMATSRLTTLSMKAYLCFAVLEQIHQTLWIIGISEDGIQCRASTDVLRHSTVAGVHVNYKPMKAFTSVQHVAIRSVHTVLKAVPNMPGTMART